MDRRFKRLYRNKLAMLGLLVIIIAILLAVFASVIAPYPYDLQVRSEANSAPYWITQLFPNMIPRGQEGGYIKINDAYPFGADALGRDLFSRLLYGARVSLLVAFVGPFFSVLAGMLIGIVAGYAGGSQATRAVGSITCSGALWTSSTLSPRCYSSFC